MVEGYTNLDLHAGVNLVCIIFSMSVYVVYNYMYICM